MRIAFSSLPTQWPIIFELQPTCKVTQQQTFPLSLGHTCKQHCPSFTPSRAWLGFSAQPTFSSSLARHFSIISRLNNLQLTTCVNSLCKADTNAYVTAVSPMLLQTNQPRTASFSSYSSPALPSPTYSLLQKTILWLQFLHQLLDTLFPHAAFANYTRLQTCCHP